VGDDNVALILGDNIFYGAHIETTLRNTRQKVETEGGGAVFGYHVANPEAYGVVSFDEAGKAIDIEEKPAMPKSNYAVPGIYFYDNQVVKMAQSLKPSPRGELEITDINKIYLANNQLHVGVLGRGTAWLDTGTHESLLDAAVFVQIVEKRQGLKVGCIEEIAYRRGFITKEQLQKIAEPLKKSGYGDYLLSVILH
jgi:glucose-1-phosphate thymidylyltransferase